MKPCKWIRSLKGRRVEREKEEAYGIPKRTQETGQDPQKDTIRMATDVGE